MSRTIDERVVELRFNNQQFEQNARTSISTLEKLKQVLSFNKSEKGLDGIASSAKKFDMSGVANTVDNIRSKFSALEIVGITALANIANQAINTGKQMINSLTIAPISDGFNEYELKMGSIQTIMMSTGESLETVNKYLDDLNTYADKTIYSFRDMTSNIGKFTNAGVGLNDATKAIQGVSNVAAISGANAWEASRAMYNFAQALSAGAVKLIDWKSIENANMATVDFKKTLLDTAVALKTVEKTEDGYISTTTDMQGKVSEVFTETLGFNNSLAHQWMTTEVLTTALQAYSNDVREMTDDERKSYREKLIAIGYTEEQAERIEQLGSKAFDAAQQIKTFSQMMDTLREAVGSGWAKSFEIIFGDFEKAKKLWTGIGNFIGGIIDKQADQRNSVLQAWADRASVEDGGRGKLLRSFARIGRRINEYVKPIKEAFDDIMPKAGVEWLGDLVWKFSELTKHMKADSSVYANIGRLAKGFFSTLKLIGSTAVSVGKYGLPVLKKALDLVCRRLLEFAGPIGLKVSNAIESLLASGSIDAFLKSASDGLITFIERIDEAIDVFKTGGVLALKDWIITQFNSINFDEILTRMRNKIEKFINEVGKLLGKEDLYASVENVGIKGYGLFNKIASKINEAVSAFKTGGISGLGTWIADEFSKIDFSSILDSLHQKLESLVNSIGLIFGKENLFGTISDTINSWKEKFKSLISSIANFFGIDLTKIENFKAETITKISDFLNTIRSFFKSDTLDAASSSDLGSAEETVKNTESLFDAIGKFFENNKIISGINDFVSNNSVFQKFSDTITQMKSSFDDLGKLVSDFKTESGDNLTSFSDKFGAFIDYVKPKLDSVDWVSVVALVGQITTLVLAFKAIAAFASAIHATSLLVSTATQTILAVKTFFAKVNGILDNFSVAKTWVSKFKSVAKSLLTISIAIAIIAISIKTIGKMDQDDIIEGAITIAGIAVGLVVMQAALAAVSKKIGHVDVGVIGTILAFAIAIKLVATSIKDIADIIISIGDPTVIEQAFNYLAMAMGALLGCVAVLALINKRVGALGSATSMLQVVGFVIALKLLVSVMHDLEKFKITDWESFITNLSVALSALIALMLISKGTSFNSGLGIIGMVLSLKLMASAFDDIANIDLTKAKKNIGAFIAVFGSIAALMLISHIAGKDALKAGFGILAISIAIAIMAGVIVVIGNMDSRKALKGVFGLIALVLAITTLSLMMNVAGQHAIRAGVAMIAIAVALGLLVGVVFVLGLMKPSVAAKGVIALIPLMIGIGLLMMTTKLAGQHALSASVGIAIIALAIGGLVYAIWMLAQLNTGDLGKAVTAIGTIMTIMGLMMVVSKFTAPSSFAGIVALSGSVVILAGALTLLAFIPEDQLRNALSVIKQLSAIMIALMFVSQYTGPTTIGKIVAIGACIGVLSGIMAGIGYLMKDINGQNMLAQMEGISLAVVSIGAVLAVLSALDVNPKDALKAGAAFDAFVVVVGALAVAAATVDEKFNGGLSEKLEKGVALAAKAGEVIGSFLKGIGDKLFGEQQAIDTSAADKLPTLGEKILGLVDKLLEASDKLSGKESSLESLKSMAEIIYTLTKAELLDGVGKFIGGASKFEDFSGSLTKLAEGLKGYAEQVSGGTFTGEAVDGSIKMAELLATLYGSDDLRTGGFIGEIVGNSVGLDNFGDQLVKLATGLKGYADEIKGGTFTGDAVDGSVKLGELLATLYGSENLKTGGFIGNIVGDSLGLDNFGDQLVKLAQGLKGYADEINKAEFDQSQIDKSKILAKMLVSLSGSEELTRGGLIGAIVGNVIPLDTFGGQLGALASGVLNYVNIINHANFDESQIDKSEKLASMVASLAKNDIPKSGGLLGMITGNKDLANFAKSLKGFAKGIVDYVNEIKDANFDYSTVSKASMLTDVIKTITDAANAISTNTTYLKDAGKQLEAFGKSTKSFITDVDSIQGSTSIDKVTEIMEKIPELVETYTGALTSMSSVTSTVNLDLSGPLEGLKEDLSELQETLSSGFTDAWGSASTAITDSESEIVSNSTSIIRSALDAVRLTNTSWKSVGTNLASSLSKSIKDSGQRLREAGEHIGKEGVSGAKDTKDKWIDVGEALADGLAKGVRNHSGKVESAAKSAAKKAYEAAKKALESRSPSRVFMRLGKYVDLGLAKGITDNEQHITVSTERMIGKLINTSKNALLRISDLVNSDMVDDPVIRPVLDLSEIQNESNRLYSMLDDVNRFSLRGNVELAAETSGSINRSQRALAERDYEFTSSMQDVAKALKGLENKQNGNTYIIDGITYDDGTNVSNAIRALIRAAKIGGRV